MESREVCCVIGANDESVYDFSACLLDGQQVSLAQYAGKVLIIVNTASRCGLTPQYAGLQMLYQDYKARGLEILAFPCNQFGAQEPGSPAQIGEFCDRQYGVSFPVFAKIQVNGPHAHPLFKFLKNRQGGLFGALGMPHIRWNFTKFLIDRQGKPVARFAPKTNPVQLGPSLTSSCKPSRSRIRAAAVRQVKLRKGSCG